MRISWDRDAGHAVCENMNFTITCDVRNELNGRRRLHDPAEVVRVVNPNGTWGLPYMPRQFPKGVWKVTIVEDVDKSKAEYYPCKIRTDAHRLVKTWHLDISGGYDSPEDRLVEDTGYLLHHSNSSTTLGCGRIASEGQARTLANMIRRAFTRGEDVELEVL